MKDTNSNLDPLPDSFETEEQAGEFWDMHSLTDYEQYLEATDDTIEIGERVFEVQVAEDVFKKLRAQAASLHQPVPKIVDEILRKELV
jgi:CopG antitoxin of type II toxin-antitoxin system